MSSGLRTLSGYYARILVSWYRLNERIGDFFHFSRRLNLLILSLALLFCWGLAVAITNEAWVAVIGLMFVGVVLPLLAVFPEAVVLLVAIMLSSVISPLLWDHLPLFYKGLSLPYVLLIYAAGVVAWKQIVTLSPYLQRWKTPTSLAIIAFLVLVVPVGLGYHTLVANYPASKQLAEMSPLVTWLIFFILTGSLTSERRLHVVQAGILIIAAVGSLATILQGIFGERALFFLKLGEKDIRLEYSEGLVRVLPPGMLFLMAFIVGWQMTSASSGPKRVLWLLLTLMGAGAILFTQLRHFWVISLFAILLMWWYSERRARVAMTITAVLLLTLATAFITLVRSAPSSRSDDFFARLQRRWESTFREEPRQYSSSLGFRMQEIAQISEQWKQSPWFGIGHGKPYRVDQRYNPYLDSTTYTFNSYIHNSFWWALGKGGIIGAIGILTLWIVGIVRGYRLQSRAVRPEARAWLLALWVCYVAFVLSAQLHPAFWNDKNIVSIAVTLGLMEVIADFERARNASSPTPTTPHPLP